MKSELTADEKLIAAYAVDIMGLTQTQVAVILNISNAGRVNEAVQLIRKAIGTGDGGYKGRDDERPAEH